MDNPLTDFIAQVQNGDGLSLETMWPATVVISNRSFPAASGGFSQALQLQFEGMAPGFEKAVRIRVELLVGISVKPESTTLLVDGDKFRVEKMIGAPHDPALYLLLKHA